MKKWFGIAADGETVVGPYDTEDKAIKMATDPPVSEPQRRAMWAAAEGHSTLGIPKSVGREFVGKDYDCPTCHGYGSCDTCGSTGKVEPRFGRAAGMMYVTKDGKVLMMKRADDGSWALPAGMREPGEDSEATARREAGEEMGGAPSGRARLLDRTHTLLAPDFCMDFSTYGQTVDKEFTPVLNVEHTEHAWVPLSNSPAGLHPGVSSTLKTLRDGRSAQDMTEQDWTGLVAGLLKFLGEEAEEPEHAEDRNTNPPTWKERGQAKALGMTPEHYVEVHRHKPVASTKNEFEQDWGKSASAVEDKKTPAMDDAGAFIIGQKRKANYFAFDRESVRTYDTDGRMHITRTPISKANVCPYYGHEIPNCEELGLDPKKVYKLLRAPEELEKAAGTANNQPLLDEHIPTTADEHATENVVGSTGTDAEFEDPYLYNSLVIWPRKAINGVENDKKRELSSAYHYDADMTPGTYKGEAYDGIMRNIRFNHVALVKDGRAGSDVLVMDAARFTFANFVPPARIDFGGFKPDHIAFDAFTPELWANTKGQALGSTVHIGKLRNTAGDAGERLLKTVTGSAGTVKVYFSRDWQEYIAKPEGSQPSSWNHTDDKNDALSTAQVMANDPRYFKKPGRDEDYKLIQGRQARQAGKSVKDNPYPAKSDAYRIWLDGFKQN